MKKIVVIGAGISGLTAGIYAVKSGFEVEIYEKNAVAGGECTAWDRSGFHIDNCIHWMMGTMSGTDLNKIWQTTHAIEHNTQIITFDKMYTSELDGKQVTLWKDLERTRKELLDISPEDAVEINKVMDMSKLAEKVQIPASKPTEQYGLFDVLKLVRTTKNALKLFKEYDGEDTYDLMNRFKNPLIRCMISDFCPKESLAHSFPMAYGNFTSGDGGIPRGGSKAMATRMKDFFESLGGKFYPNSDVCRISVEGSKALNAELSNGQKISADYFIAACDPDYTFNKLLSPSYMDDVFKDVYSNRKAYPIYGMFQVAFAVDLEKDLLKGDLMMDISDISSKIGQWSFDRMTLKTFSYEPSFAPKGMQILQAMIGLSEDSYDYWKNLYQNKDEYNKRKTELAELILEKIEQRFPEYSQKLSVLDVWTPMTYKRYCNAFKGYNQAYVPTKNSRKSPYPSAFLKGLDNVVLAGQWLSAPGGLPGAAIQGKYSVQRILKKEKKRTKI